MAQVAAATGHRQAAVRMAAEAVEAAREAGGRNAVVGALLCQASLARRSADHAASLAAVTAALEAASGGHSRRTILDTVEAVAGLAVVKGDLALASRLFAATGSARQRPGLCRFPADLPFHDADVALVEEGMAAAELAPARTEGSALSLADAAALALAGADSLRHAGAGARHDAGEAALGGPACTLEEFVTRFPDDDACLNWLWRERCSVDGEHARCPRCDVERPFRRYPGSMTSRWWACSECDHHLHPTAGTIMHGSSTPPSSWFRALYLTVATRGAMPASQLQRELGVSYNTARRMVDLLHVRLKGP